MIVLWFPLWQCLDNLQQLFVRKPFALYQKENVIVMSHISIAADAKSAYFSV